MKLTKEQVLSEPAGSTMDRWVAEYALGEDLTASSPERIKQALSEAQPAGSVWPTDNGGIFYSFTGQDMWEVLPDPHDGRSYKAGWPWEQRKGKPWQAAMEKWVSEYRFCPTRLYSKMIDAAWCVVDSFDSLQFNISQRAACWVVSVWHCETGKEYEADGDTAMLAICRVAILAALDLP